MMVTLTPRELYIDAHPMILWELLRAAGKGQLPGSRDSARLLEEHGDTLLVEFISGDGGRSLSTTEEVVFHPPNRVSYRHVDGPVVGAREEFVLHPSPNGGVVLGYSGHFDGSSVTADPAQVKAILDQMVIEHMEDLKMAAELRAGRGLTYPRPAEGASGGGGELPRD